jgi:predicted ATP-grasp superfamily ATP-dependent carboligase
LTVKKLSNEEIENLKARIEKFKKEGVPKEILKKVSKKGEEEMWDVPEESLKVMLPSRFSLKENDHFLFLFYGKKRIATFLATDVSPTSKKIRKSALRYLENHRLCDTER